MATKRIKDISTTATTFAADDFIALDASSVGTRKMAKASLITQVGANYLEKADNLSDVASKDTSKLNLEVPNVGSAANEVPVNGMLGDMSFQSSAAVTVDDLTVDGHFTGAVGKPMPVNGPSMRLDGVDDFVDFAVGSTNSAFTYNNGTDDLPYTISGWIKINADATYFNVLSKWSGSTPTSEWLFRVDNSKKLQLRMRGGVPYFDATSNNSLSNYEDQWVHVAASYAGAGPNSATSFANAASAITLYINGKSVASTTYISSTAYAGMVGSAQNVWIGKASATHAKGEIRDVKIFNKELSAAEVKEVYSNGQLPESFAESTGGADVVTDGGFENWTTSTDLTDWAEGTAISVAQSSDKISGSYSCKLTGAGSISVNNTNWLSQLISPVANKKYRLSGKVKRYSGSTYVLQFGIKYFIMLLFDGTTFSAAPTTTQLPFIGGLTSKALGNGWYSFSIDFITTSTEYLTIGVNGSTDPYLIDDVSLVQIGSVLDARAEQFDTSTGKLYDLSGNDFVGTQSGGVSSLGREMPVYETGTWTVGLEFGGTALAVASQTGTWTRIGDLVHIAGAFNLSSIAGIGSGNARITGLPFTAEAQTSRHGITFVLTAGMTGLTSAVVGNVLGGDTDIAIYHWGSTGTASLTNANFTASTYTRFSGFYQIS